MHGRASRTRWLRCAIVCALALVGLSCQTTKIINFPPPAEPCLTEADLELLTDLLGETHPTVDRAVYTAVYCLEGEERLQ
jgi:hypothetical protein